MNDPALLIGLAGVAVGLLGSIIGLVGLIFAVQANKKLEEMRVDTADLASSYAVLRPFVLKGAEREGKTVQVELKEALKLGDQAVAKVFKGHPPTVTIESADTDKLWG